MEKALRGLWVALQMTESCGTCAHYMPTNGPDAMPGFGNCKDLPGWHYVSAWPWGCRFTPSRYEGPDKNAAAPQDVRLDQTEGGRPLNGDSSSVVGQVLPAPAAAKDDRPPLELT